MSVPSARDVKYPIIWLPIASTGTKALPQNLSAGEYRVTTDTTQAFTTAQLAFNSATSSASFTLAVRGGLGTVTLGEECDEVVLGTGTFPLLMGFERVV